MDAAHADRVEMLASVDDVFERARAAQRDKALGQIGVHVIGQPQPEWSRIYTGQRSQYEKGAGLVIHVEHDGQILCGAKTGRCGDPSTVTLLVDRWCSRCWNKWAKRSAGSGQDAQVDHPVPVRRRASRERGPEPQGAEDEVPFE